jgi:hypothetical protein
MLVEGFDIDQWDICVTCHEEQCDEDFVIVAFEIVFKRKQTNPRPVLWWRRFIRALHGKHRMTHR